jgi:hypothetical protein
MCRATALFLFPIQIWLNVCEPTFAKETLLVQAVQTTDLLQSGEDMSHSQWEVVLFPQVRGTSWALTVIFACWLFIIL